MVPELASRAHQSNILPVVDLALKTAGIGLKSVDAIAFTLGPGLMGSLHVGINFAKGLAIGTNKPLIGVNHLQAHVAALFIEQPDPVLPMLCLLVSGGHTQILLVKSAVDMEIVGTTLDDAAGEAFDKAAKLLGLPYPGGPHIDKLAAEGNPLKYQFPKAKVPDLNYSFSGIKTSLLYFVKAETEKDPDFVKKELPHICAAFQKSVVDYLLQKFAQAIDVYKPGSIGLAGGVSANRELRNSFRELGNKHQLQVLIPSFEYCTDNAAMIATAGHYLLKEGHTTPVDVIPFVRG